MRWLKIEIFTSVFHVAWKSPYITVLDSHRKCGPFLNRTKISHYRLSQNQTDNSRVYDSGYKKELFGTQAVFHSCVVKLKADGSEWVNEGIKAEKCSLENIFTVQMATLGREGLNQT